MITSLKKTSEDEIVLRFNKFATARLINFCMMFLISIGIGYILIRMMLYWDLEQSDILIPIIIIALVYIPTRIFYHTANYALISSLEKIPFQNSNYPLFKLMKKEKVAALLDLILSFLIGGTLILAVWLITVMDYLAPYLMLGVYFGWILPVGLICASSILRYLAVSKAKIQENLFNSLNSSQIRAHLSNYNQYIKNISLCFLIMGILSLTPIILSILGLFLILIGNLVCAIIIRINQTKLGYFYLEFPGMLTLTNDDLFNIERIEQILSGNADENLRPIPSVELDSNQNHYCPNCGELLSKNYGKFCPHCGYNLL